MTWEGTKDYFGFSTVSDAPLLYSLQRTTVAEGARIWHFRMGVWELHQPVHEHVVVEHTEAVLVAPPGAKLAAIDLVLQFVHHPYDRRDFVRKLSQEWYHTLYETPVVRHLDPARTDANGVGTEDDPWPSYARCIEGRLGRLRRASAPSSRGSSLPCAGRLGEGAKWTLGAPPGRATGVNS